MNCPVCNRHAWRRFRLMSIRSRLDGSRKRYRLYRCRGCGLIRPIPLPYVDAERNAIYDRDDNIRFYNPETCRIDRETPQFLYFYKHFRPFKEILEQYAIKGTGIDIGCGAGHMMETLESIEGIRMEGLEVTRKLVDALGGRFPMHWGDIRTLAETGKQYDFATANHVLEHVERPDEFVRSLNRILVGEGSAILAVPYLYGLIPNILRSLWYGTGRGTHLSFFSRKSLQILFEKNGFRIVSFRILSVDYAHPSFPAALNVINNAVSSIVVRMGLGDNLFAVVRKTKHG